MLLKDLILQLQEIYKSYPPMYREVWGEPEIAIELNDPVKGPGSKHIRLFNGITPDMKITKNPAGFLLIKPVKQKSVKSLIKPSSSKTPPAK